MLNFLKVFFVFFIFFSGKQSFAEEMSLPEVLQQLRFLNGSTSEIQKEEEIPFHQSKIELVRLLIENIVEQDPFIEAFDANNRPIKGAASVSLTSEVLQQDRYRGYRIASEEMDHYTTYDWLDLGWEASRPTPLMHQNSLTYIGLRHQKSQSSDLGFIFGRIARGWEVSLSSEVSPIYVDLENPQNFFDQSEASFERERFFILMNVSPGTHLLNLKSHWGEGSGSIPVAVFSDGGSYMDLTQIMTKTLSGHLSAGSARGLFKVVGQTDAIGIALDEEEGVKEFKIQNILTVGNYPILLRFQDLEQSDIVLQYRILPHEMDHWAFHPIPSWKLDQWLSQMPEWSNKEVQQEGQSLFILAAKTALSQIAFRLFPSLQSFDGRSGDLSFYGLTPEVQIDSPYDRLEKSHPLIAHSAYYEPSTTRLLGVGSNLLKISLGRLESESAWSMLSMVPHLDPQTVLDVVSVSYL